MTRFKHLVGDSALWVALVLVFGLVATVKIVAQSSPTCSYAYSSWGECRSDGTRVRTVQSVTPDECSGEPEVEESCSYTAPTCSYTYSSWGTCSTNGKQTRTVQSQSPTECEGDPEIERSCTYSPPTCAFTYSSWGACQSNGTMTRTVLTATPSGCTGTPQTSQTCTYSGGGTSCVFTYNAWSACQSNGMRTRTVATATPSGCTGGTPILSESCTYSGGGTTTCSFTYSAWSTCQSNGTQTRTVLSAYPSGCSGGTPQTSQTCTYSGGSTPTCAFTYTSWGECQSSGIRTRTVVSALPVGCTGTPTTSETCTYSGGTTSGSTACAYTYSPWGSCQSNGTMTRTVLTATPSGCTGTPQTSQTCTYSTTSGSTTTPTCAFTYSSWSDCLSSGKRTRTVVTATPSGCVGNPDTSESCTYVSSNGTTVSAPTCNYVYSSWGNCSSNGIQTRTILSYSPTGCAGSPKTSQSCAISGSISTVPVCAYTYSSWGICQSNGLQTRGVLTQSPSNCSGNPEVNRSCSVTTNATSANSSSTASSTAPICAYTYSSWGMCQSSGTQTRSALSKTPSNCVGDPYVSQFCTYSAGATGNTTTAPACAFSYTPWSGCLSVGLETRSVISRVPSNCVGTPDISRSCTSSSGISAPACVFTYSPWISCQSNGMEMRSVVSRAPQVCAGTPELSRSCAYAPSASIHTSSSGVSATASNFAFSDLPSDMTFSGVSRVKGVISSASGVEYFLVNPASNMASSIGSAEQSRENLWERSFDSGAFPNGPFLLMARVKTASGVSESARVKVIVANRSVALSTTVTSSAENASSESGQEAGVSSDTMQSNVSEEEGVKETSSSLVALKDFRGATTGRWQKLYFGSDRCEREDFCGSDADPDSDDLANKDEFRYNTNPLAADTDGDDFSDGKEVRDGFNPLLTSRGDKNDQMTYESPKETGTVEKDLFSVANVEAISSETNVEEKVLKLSGTGPANTLINVFVYSELPTILTVKTDADGNWSYTLEESLEDGEHQVYVAVTDNAGKIAAKSEPLAFVKTAQAATVIPPAEAQGLENSVSPIEKRKWSDMGILVALILGALLVALLSIGFLIQRKRSRSVEETPSPESVPLGDESPDASERKE